MTDTNTDNGVHAEREHNDTSPDAVRAADRKGVAAQAARDERADLLRQRDQLDARISELREQRAQLSAEIERCDMLLDWATKKVAPRGTRKAATAPAKGRK